jgi:hypothetical protein
VKRIAVQETVQAYRDVVDDLREVLSTYREVSEAER